MLQPGLPSTVSIEQSIINSLSNIDEALLSPYSSHPAVVSGYHDFIIRYCHKHLQIWRLNGPRRRRWLRGMIAYASEKLRHGQQETQEKLLNDRQRIAHLRAQDVVRRLEIQSDLAERERAIIEARQSHEIKRRQEEQRQKWREQIKPREAERIQQQVTDEVDSGLVRGLLCALKNTAQSKGYVYFKRWDMGDGVSWYKIGVTNNPSRRDAEQNVLPVKSVTLACVDVGSMKLARALESTLLKKLEMQRVKDAGNREIFCLTNAQANAVLQVLNNKEAFL